MTLTRGDRFEGKGVTARRRGHGLSLEGAFSVRLTRSMVGLTRNEQLGLETVAP